MMYEDIGLVLEGGAQRAVFTAGVLDFLLEKNIFFSYVVSVSAGTGVSLSYIAKQVGRANYCMMPTDRERRGKLRLRDVVDLDKMFGNNTYSKIPLDFDAYFSSGVKHEIVATSYDTGEAVYLRETSDKKRLMACATASCSIPVLFSSVRIDGSIYFDGGVADSIPIIRANDIGRRKNVVIVTRNDGNYPKLSKTMKALYKLRFSKHKSFLNSLFMRTEMYKKELEVLKEQELAGNAFVIRPSIPEIERLEKHMSKLEDFYMDGYNSIKNRYDELCAFLES